MEQMAINDPPGRITDLAALKKRGRSVELNISFEVVPVNFTQRENPYLAHIFLCRYSGAVDGLPFAFRKCYARGCSNNLCPHVSQAIMIANRYLSRDYNELLSAGIDVDTERVFELGDMVLKFDDREDRFGPPHTLEDYIEMAVEGSSVNVHAELEYLPAVEHFGHYKNAQTFLHGRFQVTADSHTRECQRCLSCYASDREDEEKPGSVEIANARLALLYDRFDAAGIRCERKFF
jgi:hypothetical protein